MLTAERVREVLSYNPQTGVCTLLMRTSHRTHIGDVAGWVNEGYLNINIDKRTYQIHRLIWLLMTGKWPLDQIDHINRRRDDNRWCNLREATNAQNHGNRSINKNNTSGARGVSWHKRLKKWSAQICVGGKHIHLGYCDTIEGAASLYGDASVRYFGEFGRPS